MAVGKDDTKSVTKSDDKVVVKKCADKERDENWLKEEDRVFVGWNGSYKGGLRTPHAHPPERKFSTVRASLYERPPDFTMPSLPISLPSSEGWRSKNRKRVSIPIMWPYIPGSPTIASIAEEWIGNVDVIAGASLMYALFGHSRYVKECFLLERNAQGAVVVMHVPKHKRSDMDSPGHMSESICCPNKGKHKIHFSIGKFRVGRFKMATVSEVDGFMQDVGKAIEIKTRKRRTVPDLKDTVQASINGSDSLVQFKLSENNEVLESVQVYKTSFLRDRHRVAWKNAGDRITDMLGVILSNDLVQGAFGVPVVLAFDPKTRTPVITESGASCSMLPLH